jgi:PD-(D/E)XK nuclease superfamily
MPRSDTSQSGGIYDHHRDSCPRAQQASHAMTAAILSYLKLGGKSLGLLINFNVVHLKDGIKRFVNGTNWK